MTCSFLRASPSTVVDKTQDARRKTQDSFRCQSLASGTIPSFDTHTGGLDRVLFVGVDEHLFGADSIQTGDT